MKKKLLVCVFLFIAFILPIQNASAVIIDGGNVNGFDTFIDQNTGRIWMDMDSFFNMSTTDMVTAANNAGFTFATLTDVQQLLNSLPLTSGEWATTYKPYMMGAPNRDLIWGSYYESPTMVGWAWAESRYFAWSIEDSSFNPDYMEWDSIPNQNELLADLNIWAYQTGGGSVPVPSALLLLTSGILGLAGASRKNQK